MSTPHHPARSTARSQLARLQLVTAIMACALPGLAQEKAASADASKKEKPAGSQLTDELKWLKAEKLTVTTASLREEDLAHAPATVRVITRRQIEERGYQSLNELLAGLPGVDVLNHSQAESKNRIGIRGISGNNKFLILQDGIRINSPTGEPITPVLENFPLLAAKQVEVLYGPASALYGADAFTGVINIITDRPTPEGTLRASMDYGSFDTYRMNFHAAKQLTDSVGLTLGGHWQQSEGVDLSKEYPGDVVLGAQPKFFGEFSSFSTHAKLDLWENLTLGWQQSQMITPTSEGGLPASNTYAAKAESRTLLLTAYARYKHTFSERASGQVQVNYSRYEQLPESKFNNAASGFVNGFKYGLGERYQVESQFSLDLSDKHTFTTGLVFDYIHSIPHTADLSSPYDTSKPASQQGFTYAGTAGAIPIQIFETDYFTGGGFAQLQTEWNERLSTTAGLRVDYNQDYGATVNPRVGAVFQQTEATTWKALYGRAYLAPSPFLRFENFGALTAPVFPAVLFTGGFFRVPNVDLKPEQLQTFELSLSHKLAEGLTFGAAGYYTLVDDLTLAAPSPAPNTTFIPGATIAAPTSNQNIGTAEVVGVDLTLDYSFTTDRSRLDVWSSLSLMHGSLHDKVLNRDYDLPFTSTEMLRVGSTWNFMDRFILTPSVNVNGPQAGFVTAAGSANFQQRVPAFVTVNLYAEVRNRSQNISGYVRINNLLDNHYYGAGTGTGSTFFRSPQDTRWVQAGLKVMF